MNKVIEKTKNTILKWSSQKWKNKRFPKEYATCLALVHNTNLRGYQYLLLYYSEKKWSIRSGEHEEWLPKHYKVIKWAPLLEGYKAWELLNA